MTATRIVKSFVIAILLSCGSVHAAGMTGSGTQDGATAPVKVADLRCERVENQVRCTFG